MKQLIFLLSASVLLSFPANAQPRLSDPAPRLDLQTILQGGRAANPHMLPSGFVFLEFWATWCTPCVRNIPHLNELQEKFKDRHIQFISITDEPKEKIAQFLQKRKMNGWIGIDKNGRTFKNYNVSARPTTFIIDDKGAIVFEGEPSAVTTELLNDILSGKAAPARKKEADQASKLGGFGGGQDPVITANFNMAKMGYLHQEVIRPTVMANYGYGWNSNNGSVGISIIGANITHAIAYINDLPSYLRIINRSSVPDSSNWDLIFSRAKSYDLDKGRKELFDLICRTFSVAVKDTEVVKDVFVPSYHTSQKLIYKKDVKEGDPQLKTYQLLSDVFDKIETKTGTIVYCDTDATDVYLDVFELGTKYYSLSGQELINWLDKQGVVLKTGKEMVKLKVLYDKM